MPNGKYFRKRAGYLCSSQLSKIKIKSIVITGANRGIGYECALQMATLAPNEQIIIASRNMTSGNEAVKSIKNKTGHQHLKAALTTLRRKKV